MIKVKRKKGKDAVKLAYFLIYTFFGYRYIDKKERKLIYNIKLFIYLKLIMKFSIFIK